MEFREQKRHDRFKMEYFCMDFLSHTSTFLFDVIVLRISHRLDCIKTLPSL